MARALKLFRTPIGFHDAYVAAPSRKAALAAWGSAADLFARGMAEEVSDRAAAPAAFDAPGTVVRIARGDPGEAAPARARTRARRAAEGDGAAARRGPAKAARPEPKPRPSRAALDAAEADRDALATAQDAARAALRCAREQALARERRALERDQARDRAAAERRVDEARAAHLEALARWRADAA
ncbi:hypothetical protein [Sphingomonas morindae]|uniref:Cell envelope biogenesis protein TolA n=1 Tax=Sphingomonas morindae TaxID=1541170 RepID=A0ABY4XCN3_9SPHN|nr:hypothetical protein [Sphingomonas morindae]USI74728.1 hypothetical protein LHA26_18435 [Sphingomonas morindae]